MADRFVNLTGDFDDQIDEQAAYMVGRLLVDLHLVNKHLMKLEAQAMADAQEEPKR